jgi:hypothetical protein
MFARAAARSAGEGATRDARRKTLSAVNFGGSSCGADARGWAQAYFTTSASCVEGAAQGCVAGFRQPGEEAQEQTPVAARGHRRSRGDKGWAGVNVAVARSLALGQRAAAKAAGACGDGDGEGEGANALPMRMSETPASLVAKTRLQPSPKVARCQTARRPFTFVAQQPLLATAMFAVEWWRPLSTER